LVTTAGNQNSAEALISKQWMLSLTAGDVVDWRVYFQDNTLDIYGLDTADIGTTISWKRLG